jgi:signal transduction histidine kinase
MLRLDRSTEMNLRAIDLNTLVRNAVESQRASAEAKRHTFTFVASEAPLPVKADNTYMVRAITDLIVNAINYTPEGGTIRVRTYAHTYAPRAVVEVDDNGIGMGEDELAHVFERFFRADEARGSDRGGMGLSLAIVKKIIEGHRGSIDVESSPGEGSTFRLLLPLTDEAPMLLG